MKDALKLIVFLRAKSEIDTYYWMKERSEDYVGEIEGYTGEEIERQRTRFLAVWQIIEEAKLEDEYEIWKREIIESLKNRKYGESYYAK